MARKAARKPKSKKPTMPKRIFAQVSPRSVGGISMFDAMGSITRETVANFQSERGIIDQAANLLHKAGFEVLHISDMMINIAGSKATYEKAFNTVLTVEERPVIKSEAKKDTATFIECPSTDIPGLISTKGTAFSEILEGVAIEEPYYLAAAPMFAPMVSYWHLRVPGDVSLGINADKVHRTGITGKGVRVAMVDSGQYKHPFFSTRGYRVSPVVLGPGASNPLRDEVGHGTGESANIFSVAPDAQLLPVKLHTTSSGGILNTTGGFNTAVGLNPDIITCSWGGHVFQGPLSAARQALAAAIAAAWASGIVVVFSAGNGPVHGFPAQHPDVIAAGGVHMKINGAMEASNYSSGCMSNIYPGRRVPDVSGLVGMNPKAIYIMLPLEPGDAIDVGRSGGAFPNGDQTANNDGWGVFSGTSAAAPQLAGVAALMKQACGRLSPADIRSIMMKTARDVTAGRCANGHQATAGPDLATGNGLVDAYKAVMLAKVRCLTIRGRSIDRVIEPVRGGIEPVRSGIEPVRGGIEPVRGGIEPIRRGIEPPGPDPIRGIRPPGPDPLSGSKYVESMPDASLEQASLSQEEAADLEDMVVKSEIDLEDDL
jgi:hypothetical protein